ncbi:heavy-metal-associated domain-containing protein (plasmid) [Nostoc sp. C052]|uniref:heavy-metal-associated domain-containing protein n=1 Tax=Nostoc sp. C052 TaxID=2576902 RepID=UPI0015C397AF|nr:heavy-metal-associated domain-containing protein [Nostoc sp. C052]QLE46241.1 heavy-metal-associated domain-containing protein [Nostoc sp. C052]
MKLQLKVPGMTCGGCVNTITQAIRTVDAKAIVQGDPKTKIVSVETQASEAAIKDVITAAGYQVAGAKF